jgi:hypothetical protein
MVAQAEMKRCPGEHGHLVTVATSLWPATAAPLAALMSWAGPLLAGSRLLPRFGTSSQPTARPSPSGANAD